MNEKGVEELLRQRRELTGENFGQHTIEPWHNVLRDHTFDTATAAMYRLVRSGNERIPLGLLVATLNAGRERPAPTPDLRTGRDEPVSEFRAQQWQAAIALAKAENPHRAGEHFPAYAERLHVAILAKLREISGRESAA